MSEIPAFAMAALERMTDPAQRAADDLRTAFDDLYNFVVTQVEKAKDNDGKDCLDLLVAYLHDAEDAVDGLLELIEEKRG